MFESVLWSAYFLSKTEPPRTTRDKMDCNDDEYSLENPCTLTTEQQKLSDVYHTLTTGGSTSRTKRKFGELNGHHQMVHDSLGQELVLSDGSMNFGHSSSVHSCIPPNSKRFKLEPKNPLQQQKPQNDAGIHHSGPHRALHSFSPPNIVIPRISNRYVHPVSPPHALHEPSPHLNIVPPQQSSNQFAQTKNNVVHCVRNRYELV